jgi:membrane protease YdiL (CAAX protease family)
LKHPKEWLNTNYYITLGISPDSTSEEIDVRYSQITSRNINDSLDNSLAVQNEFATKAYATLSDSKMRLKYDKFLRKVHKYTNINSANKADTGIRFIFVGILLGVLFPALYTIYYTTQATAELYSSLLGLDTGNPSLSSDNLLSDPSFILTLQVLFWVGLLVGPLLARLIGKYKFMEQEKMFALGFKPKWLIWALGLGLGAQALSLSIGLLIQRAYGQESATGNAAQVAEAFGSVSPIILFLMLAVGAPIVEEIFYRGLVFTAIANRFGLVTGGIVSSLLFGVSHYQGGGYNGLFVILLTTGLGGVLAYARYRSKGLALPILIHIVFNAVAASALIFAGELILSE